MGGLSKNRVKERLKSIFRIKTWMLVLILIPLLFFTATLLRFEHLGMVERKDKVLEADAEGDEAKITETLEELRTYTISHIVINIAEENGKESLVFGTGRFYLENQYIRKAKEELAKAEAAAQNSDNPNGNVFAKAAAVCDALATQYGWGFNQAYIDCMTTELAKYPSMGEIDDEIKANIPPTALYRREFNSPVWYPSPAGIAVVISLLLIVVIFIRFLIWLVLRITLFTLKVGKN